METAAVQREDSSPAASHSGGPDAVRTPLHPHQERQWLAWLSSSGDPGETIIGVYRLDGPVDATRLQAALDEVVERHDLLGVQFTREDKRAWMIPAASVPALQVEDALAGGDPEGRLRAIASQPFDPTAGPPWKLVLLRADGQSWLMLMGHDLVFDGWSLTLFWRELSAAWEGTGREEAPSFRAIAERAGGARAERTREFWRDHLRGAERASPLPIAPPVGREGPRHSLVNRALDRELAVRLREVAARQGLSLATLGFFSFALLVSMLTGRRDRVIGCPFMNRLSRELQEVMGFVLSTLPVRVALDEQMALGEAMNTLQGTLWQLLEHGDVPLNDLLADPEIPFTNAAECFDLMFSYQAPEECGAALKLPGMQAEPWRIDRGTTKYRFTMFLQDEGEDLNLLAEFDADEVDREGASLLTEHYARTLEVLAALSGRAAVTVGAALQELRAALVEKPPGTEVPAWSLDQLFAQPADQSGGLAVELGEAGIGSGMRVGLLLGRDERTVAAMLACLRLGVCYLPLDPSQPADRLARLTGTAALDRIVHREEDGELARRLGGQTGVALTALDALPPQSSESAPDAVPADALAYLLFTSGSTGEPKGVRITRRNLEVSTGARLHYYRDHHPRRFLLFPSFGFDSSVAVIYWAAATGAELIVATEDDRRDLRVLAERIEEERIDALLCTPSVYRRLLDCPADLGALRLVVVAGESCPPALVRTHFGKLPDTALYNEYGPTEATVWASVHRCTAEDGDRAFVPIGTAVPGYRVELCNEHGESLPAGLVGEVSIQGEAVSPGYLGDEGSRNSPFKGAPGPRRSYRSGDFGVRTGEGTIRLIGRRDGQVKVRGQRLELEEVRRHLLALDEVRDAGVLVHNGRLCAWVATTAPVGVLRDRLAAVLPAFMVPEEFLARDRLPYTAEGKLDTRALVEATGNACADGPADRCTAGDAALLASIWRSILHVPEVCDHDDYFDLGGDSLNVIDLLLQIEQQWGVRLPAVSLRKSSRFADMWAEIQAAPRQVPGTGLISGINVQGDKCPILWAKASLVLLETFSEEEPLYILDHYLLQRRDERELGWLSFRRKAELLVDKFLANYPGVREIAVGGYCSGGLVALEVAKVLEERGLPPRALILEASTPPGSDHMTVPLSAIAGAGSAGWAQRLRRFLYLRLRYHKRRFSRHRGFLEARKRLERGLPLRQRDLYFFEVWSNDRALRVYDPGTYRGRVLVIDGRFSDDYTRGLWAPHLTGELVLSRHIGSAVDRAVREDVHRQVRDFVDGGNHAH